MANLTPVASFNDVPQLETTTVALAGPGGIMNAQAQALANRTAYLKEAVDTLITAVEELQPVQIIDDVESNSTTAALAAHTGKVLWEEIGAVRDSAIVQHTPKTADFEIVPSDYNIPGSTHFSVVSGESAVTVSILELGFEGQSLCIFNDGTIPCVLYIAVGITVWGDPVFTTQYEGKRIIIIGPNAIRIVPM